MKFTSPEYAEMIARDPLLQPTGRGDPLLDDKATDRLDLKVGDEVRVGGRPGVVTALCQNPAYPVKIMLEGDTRETMPIYFTIDRART